MIYGKDGMKVSDAQALYSAALAENYLSRTMEKNNLVAVKDYPKPYEDIGKLERVGAYVLLRSAFTTRHCNGVGRLTLLSCYAKNSEYFFNMDGRISQGFDLRADIQNCDDMESFVGVFGAYEAPNGSVRPITLGFRERR